MKSAWWKTKGKEEPGECVVAALSREFVLSGFRLLVSLSLFWHINSLLSAASSFEAKQKEE
jgi:hypothetical protein